MREEGKKGRRTDERKIERKIDLAKARSLTLCPGLLHG